jgi:hypothetical protein
MGISFEKLKHPSQSPLSLFRLADGGRQKPNLFEQTGKPVMRSRYSSLLSDGAVFPRAPRLMRDIGKTITATIATRIAPKT